MADKRDNEEESSTTLFDSAEDEGSPYRTDKTKRVRVGKPYSKKSEYFSENHVQIQHARVQDQEYMNQLRQVQLHHQAQMPFQLRRARASRSVRAQRHFQIPQAQPRSQLRAGHRAHLNRYVSIITCKLYPA